MVVGIFKKAGMVASADLDPHIFLTMKSAQDVLGTKDLLYMMVKIRDIDRPKKSPRRSKKR
ncbi:MAG: hypothetical protein KKI07_04755 [Euryarchaeota archaeon]|nr:hypothetical protein [Euryarchaeota archaeon]